jgi:hypothetical protein
MPSYPKVFRSSSPRDMIRVGSENDGGYVLSQRMVKATKGLLSFGLSDEWGFERHFSELSGAPFVCYDPSVTASFWFRRFAAGMIKGTIKFDGRLLRRAFRFIDYLRFFDGSRHRHIRKAIGLSGPGSLSLVEALSASALPAPLLLKMDIEGWEYRILDEIVAHQSQFVGFVIEFHDLDLHEERLARFMKSISERFVLIHFHANNHTVLQPGGLALVAEFTFMAKELLEPGEALDRPNLPLAVLDAPNVLGKPDAIVNFAD